jgi:hypothetical protein
MITECLPINEFYFLINRDGFYLKTKNRDDYSKILSWDNFLYSGKIKNSSYLYFKVGKKWFKKQLVRLVNSKPSSETIWFDINELEINGSHISEIKFTGAEIHESCENL